MPSSPSPPSSDTPQAEAIIQRPSRWWNRLQERIPTPPRSLTLISLILLGIGVLLGASIIQQRTQTQSQAAETIPTIKILPETIDAQPGDTVTFTIFIDTAGSAIVGADVELTYDPNSLIITQDGIAEGTIFPQYLGGLTGGARLDPTTGTISLSGLADPSDPNPRTFVGQAGLFATITATVRSAGAVDITFVQGSTDDSNLTEAGTGNDVLAQVKSLVVTIGGEPPAVAVQGPEYVPGQLIVKLKPPVRGRLSAPAIGPGSLEELDRQFGVVRKERIVEPPSGRRGRRQGAPPLDIKQRYPERARRAPDDVQTPDFSTLFVYELEDKDRDIQEVVDAYNSHAAVEFAEPNRIFETQVVPNDTRYNEMWALEKIQAAQAWDLHTGSNNVTVAVLDTGIDSTHIELGGTNIQERPMQFIGHAATRVGRIGLDGDIAFDDNRLVYFENDTVFIHSFATGQTTSFQIPLPFIDVIRVAINGNILAYHIIDDDLERSAVYWRDLNTGVETFIAETGVRVPKFRNTYTTDTSPKFDVLSTGKIIYEKSVLPSPDAAQRREVNVYDVQSGSNIVPNLLPDPEAELWSLKGFGDTLIYESLNRSAWVNSLGIYNLRTGARRFEAPPELGSIMDFDGTTVLYDAALLGRSRTFYLYDIYTGNSVPLSYQPQSGATAVQSEGQGLLWQGYELVKGGIGDGVIFFSKNIDGNRIIAYDTSQQRYVLINLLRPSSAVAVEGRRACFIDNFTDNVYCHTYDPSFAYPIPDSWTNARVVDGFNFVDDESNFFDGNGHGTHVAGTIGAIANNATGISGVNWNIKLLAMKVLTDKGRGRSIDILEGVVAAVDSGADVLNLSLGGSGSCSNLDQQMIDYARSLGVIVVVAAGNDSSDASNYSPASCQGALTVGATGPDDERSDFSNYGSVVDLAAPGGNCLSARNSSCAILSTFPLDNYFPAQGTSMATPHVAGAAALLFAQDPSLTVEDVERILKNTADPITTDKPIGGRLNLARALAAVMPQPTPTPTPSSTACQDLLDRIQPHLFTQCGDDDYDPVADVNASRIVDILDMSAVIPHYQDQVNGPAWCTQKLQSTNDPCTVPSTQAAPPSLPGDYNNDGTINTLDLSVQYAHWGKDPQRQDVDLNNDTRVNSVDYGILLQNFNRGELGE